MNYEIYSDLKVNNNFSVFEFVSIGKKGSIIKRIAFTPTEVNNIYNLAFGDINEDNEIDDYTISDNGDRNKILATIVSIVEAYTSRYPKRWIIFRGSTKERTRLYRMAIGLNLEELSSKFYIYAYLNEEIFTFSKNMKVSAFLIRKKIV